MGYLFYGNTAEPIEIPDRLLAHLKVVVATKLRRSESFTLSWRHTEDIPGRPLHDLAAALDPAAIRLPLRIRGTRP